MKTSSSMRLFVGLPLSASAQRSLVEFCRRLKDRASDARWVGAELMHITLFFLGETEGERVPSIVTSLGEIESSPLKIKIESVGGFDRAGIFFASVHPSPGLLTLAENVRSRMVKMGFLSKEAEYQPHITLARAKRGLRQLLPAARQENLPVLEFSVDRFVLYRSLLTKEGSHYQVVREFPLQAAKVES